MKKVDVKSIIRVAVSVALLAVLMLLFKNTKLFEAVSGVENSISLSVDMVINAAVAILLVVLVSNIVLVVLDYFRNMTGRTGTIATVCSSLVKYGAVLIAFCWVLSIIGVNVSTIFASVGIVALILGFGAESLVADLVTGVFILFENQYNVGDIIEIDGFRGKVKAIGIRTLSLEDSGGNIKIISNSELKNIINRSNQRSVAVTDVGVSYDTDLEELDKQLEKILAAIKAKHADVFIDRVECAGVESLGDSSVVLRFIADVNEENIFKGKRILNKELKIAFDKEGINIPYPQIDVHNRYDVVTAMNKEYDRIHTEYTAPSDYGIPKERLDGAVAEYFKDSEEYCESKLEYADSIEPEILSTEKKRGLEEEQKKQKRHKQTIRNMVYTVASVVTVTVLAQTAEPDQLVKGSYLDRLTAVETAMEEVQTPEDKEGIAGLTIVFTGDGELTAEEVKAKLGEYEIDGDFRVVIEEGITAIGERAFVYCDNLVTVELPSGVSRIGERAFNQCGRLELLVSADSYAAAYAAEEEIPYRFH